MPIPWLVVLQAVPWTDVIKNTPRVAEGAKKLWSRVSKKSTAPSTDLEVLEPIDASETLSLAQLQARLAHMEAATAELHSQMLASSELINTLAEQNAQLVARMEAARVRLRWLTLLMVLCVALAASALFMAWGR
jgi:chromosome segregation ATPase